ncbi:MAG: HEAT repeat domain-containing protein, partial [Candidatus Sumerlaeota bacterium]
MASEANIYLRNLKEGLFAKKLQACTEAFQQLAGLVDKPQQFGAEIGKVLKQLYDSYEADIFYSFTAWIEKHPAQDLADAAMEPVRDAFNMVRDWRKTLKDIHTESLSRLIRSQIRSRDVQAAAETTIRFIDEHTGSKTHVARQVGAILGSLNVDRARSEKLMEFLESKKKATGFRPEDYKAMRDSYAASQNNLSLSEVSQMELQWDRMHTDAVVQLMRLLPGRAASRQPSAEDVQKVHDAFHAVIAAYFSDPEHLGFAEVARLLSEFCPADPREIGPVEGIEDVAFLRMGSNDKLASVRSLRQLGKSDKLVAKVLEMAKRPMDGKAVERMVRLMGGLSSPKFAPFLIKVIENKKMDRLRNEAVDALGRVGGDQALSVLQDLLDEYCGTRIIDPPTQRKISGVIAALGRIARHPDTSDQQRNAIVLKSFRSLPESSGLQRLALQHFCTYNPAGLSPQAQQIAVHYIVNNLWSQETKSKLAKGNPNQRTELGFREMLVDILKNMGSSCLGILIPEAEKRVMQYSGAYWAMAEAFSDIGDVRALPMLERMLINTLRADDDDI